MFKQIHHISDIQSQVASKPEIRFLSQPNGHTIACYIIQDSHTFDSPEALECRGIAFDENGNIVSRPLHKFFNMGQTLSTTLDMVKARESEIVGIFTKIDGSMIATSKVGDKWALRSKKSYTSDVVQLAYAFIKNMPNYAMFIEWLVANGLTGNFEITHPSARIVVEYKMPSLTLHHVRDNVTGEYVLLNPDHPVHEMILFYGIKVVNRFDITLDEALASLEDMENQEGYIIQFKNGDMVKVKCPWYIRLHRSVTFLRERDIAELALKEELDDVKGALTELGISLEQVNEVENRVKNIVMNIYDMVETAYQADAHLDRKTFAIKNQGTKYFSLIMARYIGKDVNIADWYFKNGFKDDFTLRVLDGADRAEEN